MIKQIIVMRKDLNMRKGKMCAQAAHAAMSFLTKNLKFVTNVAEPDSITYEYTINLTYEQARWLDDSFTKICVYVNSENELFDIITAANKAKLTCYPIVDNGTTEFHGIPTLTCCAIGPDEAEKIDLVTGHLKPL